MKLKEMLLSWLLETSDRYIDIPRYTNERAGTGSSKQKQQKMQTYLAGGKIVELLTWFDGWCKSASETSHRNKKN